MKHGTGIAVLDKSVAVLDAVIQRPASLAELVERTGLPRATAYRLAVALEGHRLLAKDTTGRWAPGPRLAGWAGSPADPLLAAAPSVLSGLRDVADESAQLYLRDEHERVCVAVAERSSGLRDTVPVGARLPLTAGSAAQVLLAWAGDAGSFLQAARFDADDLAVVRRRRWAVSVSEREQGVASLSAPVHGPGPGNPVVAALSISGPASRFASGVEEKLAPVVLEAADDLTRALRA